MRTLGMIGGTSWHSTVEYYRNINSGINKRLGNHLNPPLILHSLNVELMRRGDWDEINQTYLEIALKLQEAGAEALIICANTPHKVVPFVQPQLRIPFLHIADAIAQEAKRRGLDRLGLLGTLPVTEEDYITGRLENPHGIATLVPGTEGRQGVHQLIADELTQGVFTDDAKAFLLREVNGLEANGSEGIILGCTELPLILKPDDHRLPLLDTLAIHCQYAIDFIVG